MASKDGDGRGPDPGYAWSGPDTWGATRQGLDLGGGTGPLGVQVDEPAGQVGLAVAAVSVLATVMVRHSRVEMISPAQVVRRLHPYFLNLVSICVRLSFHSMVRVGQVWRAFRVVT